jgi:Fic family protein
VNKANPPYTITLRTADYLAKILEMAMHLEHVAGFARNIKLHRENRLRTIHSSLAIEGNTLTLDEVAAVIEGKLVAGKQIEIKEVKNAYEAYDKIMSFDPFKLTDFLKAHQLMMQGLVAEAGQFRNGDVGVFDGDTVVHMGARPQFVPQLMVDLFTWARASELHPVIKSAVLHYEIEIIHPFADGNGRMGRLWQTLMLASWKAFFAWIPMESVLNQNRPQYYDAITDSRKMNDSAVFIEFTLAALYDVMQKQDILRGNAQVTAQDNEQDRNEKILAFCKIARSRDEIQSFIGIAHREYFRTKILKPLLEAGKLRMTIPDKPNSKNQKYIKN